MRIPKEGGNDENAMMGVPPMVVTTMTVVAMVTDNGGDADCR